MDFIYGVCIMVAVVVLALIGCATLYQWCIDKYGRGK